MKKEEINGFVDDSFKKITKHFHTAIDKFEIKDISDFRREIKKIKVFLHLLSMESEDGLSYRITKRMKTICGYFGIILNFLLQLKRTNEYTKINYNNIPVGYVNMLEKELEFWKKLSKNFIDTQYDFFDDKKEILTSLPDKLTRKSIIKFIHYTLYELQVISGQLDDYSLDNTRKFMEDIYYNYPLIRPFITGRQIKLFDEKAMEDCLKLFVDFRNKCMNLALLQTFGVDTLDEPEKKLLKEMENDWLYDKEELKSQLSAQLNAMHINAFNLNELVASDSLNE